MGLRRQGTLSAKGLLKVAENVVVAAGKLNESRRLVTKFDGQKVEKGKNAREVAHR